MPRQLTVLLENRPGALADLTGVLAKAEANIEAIMVEGEHDFGFARVQAHPLREAKRALKEAGYQVRQGDVLVLSLPNQPGALYEALSQLAEAGVNVETLFGTAGGSGDEPELVLTVDDAERAREVLGLGAGGSS